MKKVRRLVWVAFVALALSYVAVGAVAFGVQRRLLYLPPEAAYVPPRPFQVVRVASDDGEVVAFHRPASPGQPTLVYFHGNADQAGYVAHLPERATDGLGLYGVEFPGYGLAQTAGAPTQARIMAAAEVALSHLETTLGVPKARTVLLGQSLGSGVAVEMAARGKAAAMALVTPYTSIADVASAAFPFLPIRFLVLDRFDSEARAGDVKCPTLIVHGTDDDVVPFVLGERLSKVLAGSEFVSIPGGRHNDLWDRPEAVAAVRAFLGRVAAQP